MRNLKLGLVWGLLLCGSFSFNFAFANLKDEVAWGLASRNPSLQSQRQAMKDDLTQLWIQKKVLPKGMSRDSEDQYTVFLAIGNATQNQDPSSWSLSRRDKIRSLIEDLFSKGYRIAYDRDSPILSQMVEEVVPSRYRLGIGGILKTDKSNALTLQNPWMRLEVLLSFPHIVVAPDSVLGAALVLEGIPKRQRYPQFHVFEEGWQFDKLIQWARALHEGQPTYDSHLESLPPSSSLVSLSYFKSPFSWFSNYLVSSQGVAEERDVGVNTTQPRKLKSFGIKYFQNNFPVFSKEADGVSPPFEPKNENLLAEAVGSEKSEELKDPTMINPGDASPFVPYHLDTFIEDLSDADLQASLQYAFIFTQHLDEAIQSSKTEKGEGAVLFGSAEGSPVYESLVESTVRALAFHGYSMTTGGCGGYMAVANKTAKVLGVPSIGIPRNSAGDSPLEVSPQSEDHTRTVVVRGYEERIPILLQNRKFIVFAPGGSGTMRELASTLVKYAAELDQVPHLVFLDRDYYGGLVQWFKALNLPKEWVEKIHLFHSGVDMDRLCQETESFFSYLKKWR